MAVIQDIRNGSFFHVICKKTTNLRINTYSKTNVSSTKTVKKECRVKTCFFSCIGTTLKSVPILCVVAKKYCVEISLSNFEMQKLFIISYPYATLNRQNITNFAEN